MDVTLLMHSGSRDNQAARFTLAGTSNGFIGKLIHYTGKPAHAVAGPQAA